MIRSYDAARHLCERSGWSVSNLKLQKILYIADLNFLGQIHGRLVDEDFQAWDYGPVLPSVYRHCKAFGSKPVPDVFWGAQSVAGTGEGQMLDLAWERLGNLTAGQLVAMTHAENGAWVRKYVPGAKMIPITTQDMQAEYERASQKHAAA